MSRRISAAFVLSVAVSTLTAIVCAAPIAVNEGETASEAGPISGFLKPVGPPASKPRKHEAGEACVVDLTQNYEFTGDLSGAAVIDYRILVDGPCGVPPGTYDEKWIAHGSFQGVARGIDLNGKLSYEAQVIAGGDVEGQIKFGQGMKGELRVDGKFSDGKLSYEGTLK